VTILEKLLTILDNELHLKGEALNFTEDTKLRGSLLQLDSMAIVSVITALEEQLGFEFPEDQLDGAIFESVGSLVSCVTRLLSTDNAAGASV
jgi:acyl carrier protein